MNIILTGRPGSGKSRLALEIVKELGLKAGGISTPEIRQGSRRIGFWIQDMLTGEKRVMAKVGFKGPKVSKYGIDLQAIEFGIRAIKRAIREADVILIDEIGKMELHHPGFEKAVEDAFNSGKPVLAVVQLKLLEKYKNKGDVFLLGDYQKVKSRILSILKELSRR